MNAKFNVALFPAPRRSVRYPHVAVRLLAGLALCACSAADDQDTQTTPVPTDESDSSPSDSPTDELPTTDLTDTAGITDPAPVHEGPIGRFPYDGWSAVDFLGYDDLGGGITVGESVELGDFDGDGKAEMVVGAGALNLVGINSGGFWVFRYGDVIANCPVGTSGVIECALEDPALPASFFAWGTSEKARLGSAFAVGDLDGDGMEDLLAGSPGSDQVLLWYGNSTLTWDAPDATFNGPGIGSTQAVISDIDGNGCDELLLAAHEGSSNQGHVYLYLTSGTSPTCGRHSGVRTTGEGAAGPDATIEGEANDFAGASVASAGDFNGDGWADIVIGAPQANKYYGTFGPGHVTVLYGGTAPGSLAVCAGCLLDLSLFRDGTHLGLQFALDADDPANDDAWLGSKVRGMGDLNGDGCDDIGIGAMRSSYEGVQQVGSVFVVLGRGECTGAPMALGSVLMDASGDDFAVRFVGDEYDDKFGEALESAGDFDGDGRAEILVGEYRDDDGGISLGGNGGAVHVLYGGWSGFDTSTPSVVIMHDLDCVGGGQGAGRPRSLKLYANAEKEAFGKHVAGGRDVNGDGFADLLVGGPRWGSLDGDCGDLSCDKGRARLILGRPDDTCVAE